MAYSDENLKAKLSTLNETQDSIVSVAQWLIFHKRHADRIASYWLTRLRDSPPPKRLNYIYLVNEIVQNSRARRRDDFPNAFSPLMPEATQTAYRSSTPDIQGKIRRVVEVWRARSVFELPIQEAIEARLNDIDKAKGATGGKKTLMGQSLFNSSSTTGMPKELEPLGSLQVAVSKATIASRPLLDTANNDYDTLNDSAVNIPSPPVHAARLSALVKALASAESSVADCIKARKELISGLEKILETNRAALTKDESTHLDLSSRKSSTETKKRDVEDKIMRGLTHTSAEGTQADSSSPNDADSNDLRPQVDQPGIEPARPDFEAFTPPDGNSPINSPHLNPQVPMFPDADTTPSIGETRGMRIDNPDIHAILAKMNGTSSATRTRSASGGHGSNGLEFKRQKTSHENVAEDFVPDLGEMGMEHIRELDEDVEELLRQEGGG